MERVAAMPCVCCEMLGQSQDGKTFVHHIREDQGASQRASPYLTVPLCYECHQGKNGIHGDRALLKVLKISEIDLLAATISNLCKGLK